MQNQNCVKGTALHKTAQLVGWGSQNRVSAKVLYLNLARQYWRIANIKYTTGQNKLIKIILFYNLQQTAKWWSYHWLLQVSWQSVWFMPMVSIYYVLIRFKPNVKNPKTFNVNFIYQGWEPCISVGFCFTFWFLPNIQS